MRSSLDYAGFAQLCGRSPSMLEIMRAHNRIIPRSLLKNNDNNNNNIAFLVFNPGDLYYLE